MNPWAFLLFDVAIRCVQLGSGHVVPAVLRAAALRLLLAVFGRLRRLDKPGNVRNMDRFYHSLFIGSRALEL